MKNGLYALAIFTFIVFLYVAFNFEQPMLVKFDSWMSELLMGNELVTVFHYLGEPIVAAIVGISLLVYLAIREGNYRAMLFVVLTFAAGNGLNQLMKSIVERSRPEAVDQLTTYSFPSGHTMAGLFTLLTVTYLLTEGKAFGKRKIAVWLITVVLILLIGLSRVAENRHFATDVVAGWSIGYTWFMVCVYWYEARQRKFK